MKSKINFINMRLTPLTRSQVKSIFPSTVTNSQWRSYWGVSKKERLQKILESILISYGGGWIAWFLSFMAGSFVSGILGSLMIFNWMYTPWLSANKRNRDINKNKFYFALLETKIRRYYLSIIQL
jgi:hypothetical protein